LFDNIVIMFEASISKMSLKWLLPDVFDWI
jgi:hypothetical protein